MARILVMGGGLIGRRHVEGILAHPKAELAGLVDPDAAAAADLDVPRFQHLAQAREADGVIIATPTPLHAVHAKSVADRNLPMLIEKPVADTLDAADRLKGIRTPMLIGHHRRHHPRLQALRFLLKDGRIGTPVTASMIWAQRKPDDYFQDNWRSSDGSPVLINLVHDLDMLRFLFGDIADIAAFPGPNIRKSDRVESGAIALRFANGPAVSISLADTAPSPWAFEAGTGENPNIGTTHQDMIWITGTEGAVSFPSLTLWRGTDWSAAATQADPMEITDVPPLDRQLKHFIDIIEGRADPLCSLADGRAALAAALEIETQLSEAAP